MYLKTQKMMLFKKIKIWELMKRSKLSLIILIDSFEKKKNFRTMSITSKEINGNLCCIAWVVVGKPTLNRVKAGENFLKVVPKDHFQKFFIFSLKTKGLTKGKSFLFPALTWSDVWRYGLKVGVSGVKLGTWHPYITTVGG